MSIPELRALENVTLSLDGAQAELVLAALHMLGSIEGDDQADTASGTEAWNLYCDLVQDVYGGIHVRVSQIERLSKALKTDMLSVVHRDYRRTKTGFELKEA